MSEPTSVPPTIPPSAISSVVLKVAELIKDSNASVTDRVVKTLADKELERRAQAVMAGIERLKALETDVKKVKPDIIAYDTAGKQIGEPAYTKPKLEELNKAKAAFTKMEAALNKALEGDYGNLFNLIANKGESSEAKE